MTEYLLLRNNQQTGPYSEDALKTMGLRAYDLIWKNGKSCAWLYPCEMEEFKTSAPVAEESLYNQLYKKPAATNTIKNNHNNFTEATTLSTDIVTDKIAVNTAHVKQYKWIYVTMPAQQKQKIITITPREEKQVTASIPQPEVSIAPAAVLPSSKVNTVIDSTVPATPVPAQAPFIEQTYNKQQLDTISIVGLMVGVATIIALAYYIGREFF